MASNRQHQLSGGVTRACGGWAAHQWRLPKLPLAAAKLAWWPTRCAAALSAQRGCARKVLREALWKATHAGARRRVSAQCLSFGHC